MPSPTAYLDTCLVSGLVKEDLDPAELSALHEVLSKGKAREISLVTSDVTDSELAKLPEHVRGAHRAIYLLLEDVPKVAEVSGTSSMMLMGVGGGSRTDPRLVLLREILTGEDDARHVFQAVANEVDYFVTVDHRTILSRRDRIAKELGIEAVSPAELIAQLGAE